MWFEDDDLATAPDLLAQLQELVKHPGWVLISRILEEQAQYRLNKMVATPLNTLDEALGQEYVKGEAEQLLTLRGLPDVLIEELQITVRKMREDAGRDSTNDAQSQLPLNS